MAEEPTILVAGEAAANGLEDQTTLLSKRSMSKNASRVLGKVREDPKRSESHKPLTVYRLVRGTACVIILVLTAFVVLVMLGPLVFLVFRRVDLHSSRKCSSLFYGHWLAMWPYLFEKINGTKVVFSGDRVPHGERVMVMCNHRTEVDWMYIWNLALRKGRIGACKYALKSTVRNVPIFGWAFHVMEFLPLDRDWAVDKMVIEAYLKSFRDRRDEFWFVLFPEGTDFTDEKLIKSNNYAIELGLQQGDLKHVLLPRARGFVACMPFVHESLDAVYDLTMAYKHRCPLFTDNLFGIDPSEVHIHIRRVPMGEIPASEDGAANWLYDTFYKKDRLLDDFHRDGHFPNPIQEGELNSGAFFLRVASFAMGSFVVLRLAFQYFWLQVYMAFGIVILTAVTFFNMKMMPVDSQVTQFTDSS